MSSHLNNLPGTWANYPAVAEFWERFDTTFLSEFADQLVAIGQYDLGFRLPGTGSGRRAAGFIAGQMAQIGLQEVRQEPFTVYGWDFKGAKLQLNTPQVRTLPASSFAAAPGTPPGGLTAELIDVGHGAAADYAGRAVQGKIAFVHVDFNKMPWIGTIAHEAELHGAVGVVMYYLNKVAQHSSGTALNCQDGNLRQTIPVLHLCRNDGELVAGLLDQGQVEVTLHCQATHYPQATGYNVLGLIPGTDYPDRYLLMQAHYDSWFYGYWDNTIGLGGILTIAKALIESGYRPRHTLLFASPDAEEFGAVDTAYSWLYGCHRLIEAHPEWIGRMTCAFNIDTLAHRWQRGMQFIGNAEMLPFMRQVTGDYRVTRFPLDTVGVVEQITPWTEVFNYAYFGIPVVQPRFKTENDAARVSVYHTQLDDASVVDLEGAAEILKVYGTLMIYLDQQAIPPYNFTERAYSIRTSLNPEAARLAEIDLKEFEATLTGFELWATQLETKIAALNGKDSLLPAVEVTVFSDRLRHLLSRLLPGLYYTEGDFPDTGRYEHLLWEQELLALDRAIIYLDTGRLDEAIAALTDPETGVQGGWYAPHVSRPVYYRHTNGSRDSREIDLLWGEGRTIPFTDIWTDLHNLRDKHRRGVSDVAPELESLGRKRQEVAQGYGDALERLRRRLVEVVEHGKQL